MESSASAPPTLTEVDQEVANARDVITRSITPFLKSIEMISESYLAQALIALWDSGVYEYVRRRGRIEIEAATDELKLDGAILRVLIEYLLGRGLLNVEGAGFVLSDKGRAYWNYVTRGALISHLAGYNALLTHLGPALRKEIDLRDPSLARSERLVAVGAACTLLGSDEIPWILDAIREQDGQCVLDLGCGSGIFLTHLLRQWEAGRAIGIDRDPLVIAEARKRATACGLADRVEFHQAVLSAEPLALSPDVLSRVDVITAVFLIHEFSGRGGDPALVSVFASLRKQLPGRKLLLVEGSRADPYEKKVGPVRSHSQLDYSMIHPLSGQGKLKTPEEWQQLVGSAGARFVKVIPGFKLIPTWINLYVIEL